MCLLRSRKLQCLAVSLSLLLLCRPLLEAREPSHQATVIGIEDLSPDIKRIRLECKDLRFEPGQFVLLKAPDDFVEEWNRRYQTSHRDVWRPYSFASSPGRLPVVDLIVKLQGAPRGKDVPPGLVSTFLHTQLQTGGVLELSGPMGSLYVPSKSHRSMVLVAGGVGVSPFVGLLEYWFENDIHFQRQIYLFFGARSRQDLILHEQFTEWTRTKQNFHYIPALSNPAEGDDWQGETGYINQVLDSYFGDSLHAEVCMAGPPIMIRETTKVLKAKGLEEDLIRHDPIEVR